MKDSVRFTVERTLVEYKGHLSSKSSFVDKDGNIMGWHDFGNLEGPGWAANAVGGAYELFPFGRHNKDSALQEKALSLLDHVLKGGFINYETGFITGYRETTTDQFCLNYQHKNNWFCPGSMAKIAYQLLLFSDLLDEPPQERRCEMSPSRQPTGFTGTSSRRPTAGIRAAASPTASTYPQNAYGDGDILFEKSADGLFIIQLNAALTQRGLADYTEAVRQKVKVFMERGGIFGSINHDTYDEHENVAYSVAFRTLRQVAKLLNDEKRPGVRLRQVPRRPGPVQDDRGPQRRRDQGPALHGEELGHGVPVGERRGGPGLFRGLPGHRQRPVQATTA